MSFYKFFLIGRYHRLPRKTYCSPYIDTMVSLSGLQAKVAYPHNGYTIFLGVQMESKKEKKEAVDTLHVNEKKWTKPLMEAGWLAFPSIILEKQQTLGLTSLDINIILYLATYWWTVDNKPRPSKNTIAEAVGVTARTVQRRIAAMEKAGFIQREERRSSKEASQPNFYHFDGLIKEATPFALEKINLINSRKEEDKSRQTRRRAVLSIVPKESGLN